MCPVIVSRTTESASKSKSMSMQMQKLWGLLLMMALVGLGWSAAPTEGTADVMKDVTLGFGDALERCREQSGLADDDEVLEEFFHFWRDDFRFEHRQLGCAFHCMSMHYNLLTDEHRMHHQNTHDFIRSFPNGEQLSHQMVSIIHECEQAHDSEQDHCWRILRVAECFKASCQRQGIAPSMEMLMAEFIMEVEAES